MGTKSERGSEDVFEVVSLMFFGGTKYYNILPIRHFHKIQISNNQSLIWIIIINKKFKIRKTSSKNKKKTAQHIIEDGSDVVLQAQDHKHHESDHSA